MRCDSGTVDLVSIVVLCRLPLVTHLHDLCNHTMPIVPWMCNGVNLPINSITSLDHCARVKTAPLAGGNQQPLGDLQAAALIVGQGGAAPAAPADLGVGRVAHSGCRRVDQGPNRL